MSETVIKHNIKQEVCSQWLNKLNCTNCKYPHPKGILCKFNQNLKKKQIVHFFIFKKNLVLVVRFVK